MIAEKKVSRTAGFVTFYRACSHKEKNKLLHVSDMYAKQFLSSGGRLALRFCSLVIPIMERSVPGSYEWIIARTLYLDNIMEDARKMNFEQIVILGAGYDSRFLRFGEKLNFIPFFELDSPSTQFRKIKILKEKGIMIPQNMHFIPIDFDRQELDSELMKGDFKKDKKDLFIWEGVTGYLTPEGIDNTLRSIHSISASGSRVALTYIMRNPSTTKNQKLKNREVRSKKWTGRMGEPLKFTLEKHEIKDFLHERGFKLIENKDARELDEIYFQKPNRKFLGHITPHSAIAFAENV